MRTLSRVPLGGSSFTATGSRGGNLNVQLTMGTAPRSPLSGMATAASNAGVTAGGAALGFEVTRTFGIEGLAEWLDRPTGEEGFDTSLSAAST